MSIDETIEYSKRIESDYRERSERLDDAKAVSMCIEKSDNYKHIAEWLEELKYYQEMNEKNPFLLDMYKHDKEVSNKAIDDVTEKYFDAIENILHEKDLCLTLSQAFSIYSRIMMSCNKIKIVEKLKK